MVIDENSSQTDSSDEMETFRPNAEGMIRLEEIPTEPPGGANLTLTIGVQLFGLQMGSGSGYANTEEANVAIEEDVGYAGEQKAKRKCRAITSSMWGKYLPTEMLSRFTCPYMHWLKGTDTS
ncbi:hypothetical protein DY000_02037262 [Brassica cretica]|uniref:Uncharacterized protein n=1 Tax=Brassica cretica TaxID=69181 RepID=A0ABQ7B552_BRACR|nr:hypothetical protein DY000_02037262 [Brassica cretica]